MLTSYFDDSGTHDDSPIVLVAGLFGTEWQIDSLDRAWKAQIDRPLDGAKPPLKRFHMYDCQNSLGEFKGWTRTESDYFCHHLRKAIIDSHVALYGVACSREDWDELITGVLRPSLGNAEGNCIRNCFVKSLVWARSHTFDPQITYIFDNRPSSVQRDAKAVFDAFEKESNDPQPIGCAFLSSMHIRPLQAADMIAWELYLHANDILVNGINTPLKREHLQNLVRKLPANFQIATRETIVQIRDHWLQQPPENLNMMANHFSSFDPENPDYSHLSKRQSS